MPAIDRHALVIMRSNLPSHPVPYHGVGPVELCADPRTKGAQGSGGGRRQGEAQSNRSARYPEGIACWPVGPI